jgi:hypothetical protein
MKKKKKNQAHVIFYVSGKTVGNPYFRTSTPTAMSKWIFALLWLYAYGFLAMMVFQTWGKPVTIAVYVASVINIDHTNFVTIV